MFFGQAVVKELFDHSSHVNLSGWNNLANQTWRLTNLVDQSRRFGQSDVTIDQNGQPIMTLKPIGYDDLPIWLNNHNTLANQTWRLTNLVDQSWHLSRVSDVFYWFSLFSSEPFSPHCIFSRVHATLHPALSVGRLVTLHFFYNFHFLTSQLMP